MIETNSSLLIYLLSLFLLNLKRDGRKERPFVLKNFGQAVFLRVRTPTFIQKKFFSYKIARTHDDGKEIDDFSPRRYKIIRKPKTEKALPVCAFFRETPSCHRQNDREKNMLCIFVLKTRATILRRHKKKHLPSARCLINERCSSFEI